MESESESTFRPVIWLMAGRVLGQAAAFLIPVVLVRTFDPAAFGSYKRLFLLYGTLYGIAQLGFAESLYYFLPKAPRDAGKMAANAMAGLACAGLACLGALVLLRTPIARGLGDAQLAGLVPWVGLFLAPMLISAVLEIAMVSRKSAGAAALAYMTTDLLRAAFLVLPALLFFSLKALLAGAIAFALVRLVATLAYLWRDLGGLRLDGALLKGQLAYALPFALAVTIDVVQANLHQYVVSSRTDAATFAIYSVALLQVPLVDQTATTTSSVAMVQMGEALHQGRTEAVRRIWHDTVAKLGLLFFPLVALLIAAGREIILALFTARYSAAIPLFQLAAIGIAFYVLQTDTVLRVLAETRFLFGLNVLRLALVAALIVPLLSRFGLMGAVGATLISTAIARGVAMWRIQRLQGLSLAELLPWKRLALAAAASAGAGVIAGMAELELARLAALPALVRLAAISLVFTVAYAASARLLGLLPPLGPREWLTWIRGGSKEQHLSKAQQLKAAEIAAVEETACAASQEP